MTLTEGGGLFGPLSTDGDRNRQLESERGALANRFLEIRWEADENGNVTKLIVSGQVPVYDDVESVSRRDDIPDDGYVVEGSLSDASPADLRDAPTDYPGWVEQRYLQLPNTITPQTNDLVEQITANDDTVYDKAKSIEAYLRANITYDTNVGSPPEDRDVVDFLLFDNPRGYCEHYATAMTVMLRTLGIPARVAAGYAPGEYDQEQGQFVYLQSEAHAWVEVYFPDYGWVPFEPTTTESIRDLGTDADTEGDADFEVTPESSPTVEEPENDKDDAATPTSEPDQPALTPVTTEDDGGSGNPMTLVIAGVVAGVVVASVALWWLWFRRLRGLPVSAGLFARLLRLGRFFGIRPKPSTTPTEYAQTLSERLPMTRGYAESIVHAYELDQYAPSGSNDRMRTAAADAWKHVRTSVMPAMLAKFIPRRLRKR
jgi:transglutaminase-like putative cysteine protease